jgi:hypothetical protein
MESKDMLDFMVSKDFDPTMHVLLEKNDGIHCPADLPIAGHRSQTQILSYRPDEIHLETDSSDPGYLFLSEVFYPGWSAFVDGKPKMILQGNFLFRVIEIPAGTHNVTLIFDPLSIKVGGVITLLTLTTLLLAGLVHILGRIRHQLHNMPSRFLIRSS